MTIRPEPNDFARQLRRAMTDAERRLWYRLRGHRLGGAHFRRQYPVGPYVADFVCLDARLIVEVDGGQHSESDYDQRRTSWLQTQGFEVLRFWNPDVLQGLETVCEMIQAAIERRLAERKPKT
jgi:very-short-patch-repair endonuclease